MKLKAPTLRSSLLSLAAITLHAQAADDLYLIYMNPFEVQKYEQSAIDAGYVRPQVPSILKAEEVTNYIMRNIEEFSYSPGVEQAQNELVKEFSLKNVLGKAIQMPAFYAQLNEREVAVLSKSDRVVSVTKISEKDARSITFSSYYDYSAAGEVIPWGKQAVNADDAITASNNFYIVDTKWNSPALSSEINLTYTNGDGYDAPDHAAATLSIATAKRNSAKIRGINPGQPVVHLGMHLDTTDIITKIALISSMAEWSNQFSTVNLSFNQGDGYSPSIFSHNALIGNVVRRASGRLLVVQSAGNNDSNACLHAFNYNSVGANSKPNDGVLVVGGTDRFGDRYPETSNPYPFATEPRSNFGACIEAWAPGASMTTSIADGSLIAATGTSFSAPVVAALAGRYGSTATRPIEREAYILNNRQFTGKYEGASGPNLPIYQAKYVTPSYSSIPWKFPVSAVYSQTNTANINKLVDEKFYDGIDWTAAANWGSIVLDLGSTKSIKGIRVMMRSSANGGQLDFAVHGGNTINITAPGKAVIPDNPIAYSTFHDQFDLVPYYIPLNGNYRYVMLNANNHASWLSYSEVEVYGF